MFTHVVNDITVAMFYPEDNAKTFKSFWLIIYGLQPEEVKT